MTCTILIVYFVTIMFISSGKRALTGLEGVITLENKGDYENGIMGYYYHEKLQEHGKNRTKTLEFKHCNWKTRRRQSEMVNIKLFVIVNIHM